MKTDLSPDTDVSLLPRADLPVIWDAFKAKADAVRATAETLTVTCITQKEEMALARTTRLTLREIRIAVENKRVELGESHLKEIKKVNGAANAIKEFIQPLEARLLVQESFAEQHEILRIAGLSKSRTAELLDLRRNFLFSGNIGALSQEEYDILLTNLRNEKAEIEAANRLRIEAESRLAAQKLEMELREVAIREEAAKLLRAQQAEARAEQERQHAAARVELDRANAIAEAKALEVYAELKRQNEAEHAIRVIERLRLDAEKAVRDADLAEQKRIRDEQYAKLEAELAAREEQIASAALDAARVAAVEEKRLRDIACAPDVEKLREFAARIQGLTGPVLVTREGKDCFGRVSLKFNEMVNIIHDFCRK